MSEVDRPDSGALTESPTLLPQPGAADRRNREPARSGGTPTQPPEVEPKAEPKAEPEADAPAAGEPATNGAPTATNPDGTPKKRRRRGSRGGRGRKKPNASAGGNGGATAKTSGGGTATKRPESATEPQDWTDADADRGLTDDDIG